MQTIPGQIILIGMIFCLIGIAMAASAGISKEREMTEEQKHKSIKEFDLKKGLLVAVFSGIMSSCMSYGLSSGNPIAESAMQYGAAKMWSGFPKLIIVMAGGFVTNFIWCMYLLLKNKTLHQYSGRVERIDTTNHSLQSSSIDHSGQIKGRRVPLFANYLFSAMAGTVWYFQYFFYTMGESQMGKYQFSSWTLHMASIIIFSSLWGIYFKEWHNTSGLTKFLLALALFTLVGSTIILGYANLLGTHI